MSQIYIIQYDVKDDSLLKEKIKSLGSWLNYFPNSLIVESGLTAKQIYETISVGFEKDRILVVELKANYWGVMPKTVWDWFAVRK